MRVFLCIFLVCLLLAGCASAGLAGNPPGANGSSLPSDLTANDPGTTVPATSLPVSIPVLPPKTEPWDDGRVALLKLSQLTDLKVRQDYCDAAEQLSPEQVTLRVLGIFDETYVLFVDVQGMVYAQVITTQTVAGYTFRYSCYHTMEVYHDGVFYTLQDAFAMGIITGEQIAEVAARYYGVYPTLAPGYDEAYE